MGKYDPKTPGRFNSVNITLGIVLFALLYGGAFYLPIWYPIFRLKGVMAGIGNDAYRIFDDDALRKKLIARAKPLGGDFKAQDFTVYRDMEGMEGVDPDSAIGLRGKRYIITFEKSYRAKWPLIEKYTTLNFRRVHDADLAVIKY